MKKLLIIIFILSSYCSFSQSWTPVKGRLRFDGHLGIPVGDTALTIGASDSTQILMQYSDSIIYYKRKGNWKPLGIGGSSFDSSSISNRINLKLTATDTAAMLNPYLRISIAAMQYATIANLNAANAKIISDSALLKGLINTNTSNIASNTTNIALKKNNNDSTGNQGYTTLYQNGLKQGIIFINVLDYGAVGDGVTDNTVAFNSARAAAKGKVLYIPSGVFVVTNFTISDSLYILGAGVNSIMKISSGGSSKAIFTATGTSDWTIENLTLQGYNTHGASYTDSLITNSNINGIQISGLAQRWRVKACNFIGFNGYGIYGTNPTAYVDSTLGGKVTNSNFKSNYCGLYFGSFIEYSNVTDCHFSQNVYGVWNLGGNNKYASSDFKGGYYGFILDAGSNDSHGSIENCDFNHDAVGLTINAISKGEVISGNNFHTTAIVATGSIGLSFIGNEFGNGTITFNGVHTLMFALNFASSSSGPPTTTVTSSTNVKSLMNTNFDGTYWQIIPNTPLNIAGALTLDAGSGQGFQVNQNGNNTGIILNAATGSNPLMSLRVNGTTVTNFSYNGTESYFNSVSSPLSFYSNNTKRATFSTAGDLNLANKTYHGNISTVPTALVDIAGSATSAAGLRVESGVAPTTPNDGDIWNDGTAHHLYVSLNGTSYQLDQPPSGGVTTMAAIGATPNANGASISSTTLTLQPASASFGGVMTTGTQSFAGDKTWGGASIFNPGTGQSILINQNLNSVGLNLNAATGNNPLATFSVNNSAVLNISYNSGSSESYINSVTSPLSFYSNNAKRATFNSTGNFNIANKTFFGNISTTPTALVTFGAGQASANGAPLKFTAGTNLTTTEAGAVEYDGTHLYFTAVNAGTRYQLDQLYDTLNTNSTVAKRGLSGHITATGLIVPGATNQASLMGNGTTKTLISATYTPTATAVTNVTSTSSIGVFQYTRIGNILTVSGTMSVTPTSGATQTIYKISLPVAATSTTLSSVAGVASFYDASGNMVSGNIDGSNSGYATITTKSQGAGAILNGSFHFTYVIDPANP